MKILADHDAFKCQLAMVSNPKKSPKSPKSPNLQFFEPYF